MAFTAVGELSVNGLRVFANEQQLISSLNQLNTRLTNLI